MTKTRTAAIVIALAVWGLPALARAVPGGTLTGTWTGSYSCAERNTQGTLKSKKKPSVLEITDLGTSLAIVLDGVFSYKGVTIPDAKKPATAGQGVFIQCGTDNVPFAGEEGEIVRVTFKLKADSPKASLTGFSIFENADPLVGTCKYKFNRTDPADPAVTSCPVGLRADRP